MKVVKIKWYDSFGSGGWTEIDELNMKPAECLTIGQVIQETSEHILVTSTVGGSQCLDPLCIPTACIQEIVVLDQVDEMPLEQVIIDACEILAEQSGNIEGEIFWGTVSEMALRGTVKKQTQGKK